MLVTFYSSAASDLTMFGDVARRLLEVLGKEPTAFGAMQPNEYPEALQRLGAIPPGVIEYEADGGARHHVPELGVEPHELVALGVRAHPFAGMIRQADAEHAPIWWHSEADFFTDR